MPQAGESFNPVLQGMVSAYLIMGGLLMAWSIPAAWRNYQRKNAVTSAASFVVMAFVIWLVWIAIPIALACRRRG